jgi:hypothetical protein
MSIILKLKQVVNQSNYDGYNEVEEFFQMVYILSLNPIVSVINLAVKEVQATSTSGNLKLDGTGKNPERLTFCKRL